jgi:tRNA threonylcarbamoyl adenosine modification protein YeaZ
MTARDGGVVVAIDTATRVSIVAVGAVTPSTSPAGTNVARVERTALGVSRREVRHRHGSQLLTQLDEALAAAGVGLGHVTALAVGTGPGSFTGLRVGLATAKTLAHVRDLPLVGVPSTDALRHAAIAAGAPAGVVIVLPAGAHDHYLAREGEAPSLIAPGDLEVALGRQPVATVDADPLGAEAARLGEAAVAGLPDAILALARERLARHATDEPALLVPAYVALPRGVRMAAEELGWSPDLR